MSTPGRRRPAAPTPAPGTDEVELVDLQVVRRWSLALREASAPRDEVLAALEADLQSLRAGAGQPAPARRRPAPRRQA